MNKNIGIETNQEKIIDLLTEIKVVLEEIRDQESEKNEKESFYCDQCEETCVSIPYESINEFNFCTQRCYED